MHPLRRRLHDQWKSNEALQALTPEAAARALPNSEADLEGPVQAFAQGRFCEELKAN